MTKKAVLYLSKATKDFSPQEIDNLYQSSLNANQTFNISGFLCYKENMFLQYIEGATTYIDKVFNKIKNDSRHNVLVSLVDDNIIKHRFSRWNMHLVNKTRIDELEISFSLYEQLLMLEGREVISPNVQNLVWQGVGVVSKYHADLHK